MKEMCNKYVNAFDFTLIKKEKDRNICPFHINQVLVVCSAFGGVSARISVDHHAIEYNCFMRLGGFAQRIKKHPRSLFALLIAWLPYCRKLWSNIF